MKLATKRRTSRRVATKTPPTISFDELQRDKTAARLRDRERIATSQSTPEEMQRENSIFTHEEIKEFKILNLEKTLLRLR